MLLTEVFQEQYFRSNSWNKNMIARKSGDMFQFREIGMTGWNKLDINVSTLKKEDFIPITFKQTNEETGVSLSDILKMEKIETKLFRANIWLDGVVMKVVDGEFYIANVELDNWQKYALSTIDILATSYVVYDLIYKKMDNNHDSANEISE